MSTVRDYAELSKSRIVAMVLVTTAATYCAARGPWLPLIVTIAGTALLAAGTNAMNEVLEHAQDARMLRTRNRPIPSGRITPRAGAIFAVGAALAGTVVLLFVNALTALVGALTFITYNFVYTPLKQRTTACTAIGALPGAAPALLGWTAATGRIGAGGAFVFALLFLWQLPHFMAISWTHRADYERAGFAMLSVRDSGGAAVARHALGYSALLLGLTSLSAVLGVTTPWFPWTAAVAGAMLVAAAIAFAISRNAHAARRLFVTSNLYLVATMLLLAFTTACSSDHSNGKTIEGAAPQKTSTLAVPAAVAVIGDLQNPESVLHDPEQDVYFISNINGGELAADGNGFITRVDAKTFAKELKWIESGRNGVQLDGPKGMTILGDTLYVSDVTGVRKFDRRTGAPRGFIPIPNATFVNDLTNDGRNVYASDTGLAMGPGVTFLRTGTEAIWRISGDRATKIAAGVELKEPNGLLFADGKLLVASFGANELYELSDDRRKADVTELPAGELDGIVRRKDGTLLVSSWKGDAVYRGSRDGSFEPVLLAIDAPADIGYDATRDRLLVPRAFLNQVTVHALR